MFHINYQGKIAKCGGLFRKCEAETSPHFETKAEGEAYLDKWEDNRRRYPSLQYSPLVEPCFKGHGPGNLLNIEGSSEYLHVFLNSEELEEAILEFLFQEYENGALPMTVLGPAADFTEDPQLIKMVEQFYACEGDYWIAGGPSPAPGMSIDKILTLLVERLYAKYNIIEFFAWLGYEVYCTGEFIGIGYYRCGYSDFLVAKENEERDKEIAYLFEEDDYDYDYDYELEE
ncbi:hypothetical protein HO913_03775 [Streptococcus suis]|nr:hypothetical protein [Streptococcus suis]